MKRWSFVSVLMIALVWGLGYVPAQALAQSSLADKLAEKGLTRFHYANLDFNRQAQSISGAGLSAWAGKASAWAKKDPSVIPTHWGFFWNSGDGETADWMPQGITAFQHGAQNFLAVSWYDVNDTKGARITFVNVTDSQNVWYRHVLLATPTNNSTLYGSFTGMHAGGLAYRAEKLYVPDSRSPYKIHIFNLNNIFEVIKE